jgi:GNAT superfamily N-acetyltransferase
MRTHFRKKGFVLGTLSADELIAFRNVYFPDKYDSRWNLGLDIGLADTELDLVANLQMVCVHPDFRGHGLAGKMNLVALRCMREMGAYKHICATVHPHNFWNVRILLHCGFSLRRLKLKYGGKIRYIAYLHLTNPIAFDDQPSVDISLTDLPTHHSLMRQGYHGVGIKKTGAEASDPLSLWYVTFKKPIPEPLNREAMVYVVPDCRRNYPASRGRHTPVIETGKPNGSQPNGSQPNGSQKDAPKNKGKGVGRPLA